MAEIDPRHITEAVHARADEWANLGAQWSLTVGSEPSGPVASLTCETDRSVVDLIVGADGDAEMKVTTRPGRLTSLYYYRLATADDVGTCLDELTRQIIPAG